MANDWKIVVDIAQVVASIATAWALFVMIDNNKQQREQWLNDAFVKEEARMWLEFRERTEKEFHLFFHFVEAVIKEEKPYYSDQDFNEEFNKYQKKINEIIELLHKLKPYWSVNINFGRLKEFLIKINDVYFNLPLKRTEIQIRQMGEFTYSKIEDGSYGKYSYKTEKTTFLRFMFLSISNELYPNDITMLETYVSNPRKETIEKALGLFKQEIDQINEILNEKVTAHLKK